jgi:ABC-type glutathione transport system ATPase component
LLTPSVSLARAVYSRASTIILDDVISAVDAHTSQHIISKCFKSPLIAGRTIIIASHAVEALATFADHAVYLDDGAAKWQGTGLELLETEHMAHLKSETSSSASILEDDPNASAEPNLTTMHRKASLPSAFDENSFEVVRIPAKTPMQLLVDEDRAKGSVAFSLWTDLLRMNGGPTYFTLFITTTLISIVAPVGERQVIKYVQPSSQIDDFADSQTLDQRG